MTSVLVIVTVASAIIGMGLYMSLVWWLRGGIYIVVDGFSLGFYVAGRGTRRRGGSV
ncbi:hypothetical protein [Bosea sp. LjRoot237]|uniref:hypothetical protein n=1 Tax=Bosea sp. LjRoot237 TaxID=3342292 RepID=UPI003ED06544